MIKKALRKPTDLLDSLCKRSSVTEKGAHSVACLDGEEPLSQLLTELISLLEGSALFLNPSAELPFWCKKWWKRLLILDQLHENDFHQMKHFHHPGGLKNHLWQSWEMLVTEARNYSGWGELWEVPTPQSLQPSRQPVWPAVIYSAGAFGFAATLPAGLSTQLIHLPPWQPGCSSSPILPAWTPLTPSLGWALPAQPCRIGPQRAALSFPLGMLDIFKQM